MHAHAAEERTEPRVRGKHAPGRVGTGTASLRTISQPGVPGISRTRMDAFRGGIIGAVTTLMQGCRRFMHVRLCRRNGVPVPYEPVYSLFRRLVDMVVFRDAWVVQDRLFEPRAT